MDGQGHKFIKCQKVISLNDRHVENKNNGVFFRLVNEGYIEFVQVCWFVYILVKLVLGGDVIDVINDLVENIHA